MALEEPVTTKLTESGENERLEYAASAMQGYREQMEDAHAIVLELDSSNATSFFGVYDGHGGPAVAQYCSKHLHDELLKQRAFSTNVSNALQNTFLRMDQMLRNSMAARELSRYGGNAYWKKYKKNERLSCLFPMCVQKPEYEGPAEEGCTACVAVIRGNDITVANAGDSRCIISRNGQVTVLSTDHKPDLPGERQRIENAGFQVVVSPLRGNIARINDGIAVSRTIGDLNYKNDPELDPRYQPVTAFPEIRNDEAIVDTEFLVIACDGIWDCMGNQELVDYVLAHLHSGVALSRICESILSHCLAQPRGRDNMSIILVRFKQAGISDVTANTPAAPPGCRVSESRTVEIVSGR